MKFATIIISCAVISALFWGWSLHHESKQHLPGLAFFEPHQLLELEPFGDFDPDQHFTKDLSLIFYFSELSCKTCTTRELTHVNAWYEKFADDMDFYLVVQGQDPIYLNNLKRLGRVKYPILLEESLGQLGLPKTTIALFRKNTQEILATYFPTPENPHPKALVQLEQRLFQELGASGHPGAKAGSI